MKGAQYMLEFLTSHVIEFVFDPDTLEEGLNKYFYDYEVKILCCMKIRKTTGEILNWSKAFGK